ncbi:hypothetical protein H632_c5296p0, partial [Helicosporidium sp. ATCC 50920]
EPLVGAGVDSLGAVELRDALAARFGVELAPTLVYDCGSAQAVAEHVAELLARRSGQATAGEEERGFDGGWLESDDADESLAPLASPSAVLPAVLEVLKAAGGASVEAQDPLMEAGLDSVSMVEARAALRERLGVELGPTDLFDHPTPAALAQHIAASLA